MAQQGLTQGALKLPGATSESKALVERLLAEDLEKHHCFYGKIGFHNHLPHHLLAAYDYGAPTHLLQKIYDDEAKILDPVNLVDRKERVIGSIDLTITRENWTEHLGPEKNYIAFLAFFTAEVETAGVAKCLEDYIFSPRANGNGSNMLLRFVGGAVHPIIQVGHGVQFNLPGLVASGLAQTAVTGPVSSVIYDDSPPAASTDRSQKPNVGPKGARQPSHGPSLLSIMQQVYASDIMTPVMPYDPDALLSTRTRAALADGRAEEIRRISSLWTIDTSLGDAEFDARAEELVWLATLLTAATGKHGRKPRLDFFLMHLLNTSIFVPSLLKVIPTPQSKARLLRVLLSVALLFVTVRGRPRIDPALLMSYSACPRPPTAGALPEPDTSALGDPRLESDTNPWPAIVASVVHAPDAHTLKAIRILYFAAQHYGTTPPGGAIGAFGDDGKETIAGCAVMDGTIFVKAAGAVMDTLGWVSHGQKEGRWDRSALGWDAAWEGED